MVGHPAVHDFERLVGLGGRTTTFHGFVESKTAYPPAVAHVTEIFEGCYRLGIQCQRAGVRGDNEATRGLRVQGEGRQSERLVIVGGILLFWRARSLGNSPRDSTGRDKSALVVDGEFDRNFQLSARRSSHSRRPARLGSRSACGFARAGTRRPVERRSWQCPRRGPHAPLMPAGRNRPCGVLLRRRRIR